MSALLLKRDYTDMTDVPASSPDGSNNRRSTKKKQTIKDREERVSVTIEAVRSGEWVPAEELKDLAAQALRDGKDLLVNMDGIGYLDASVLQVLVAMKAEQEKSGGAIQLASASTDLQRWFEYAGATGSFSLLRPNE